MSSTESELEEVAERDPSPRVLSTESQLTKVSTNSRVRDHTELLPKRELAEDAETSESSTLTGLVKTEPSSSSKSSSLTPSTRPSEETPELTGSPPPSTSTEKTEV